MATKKRVQKPASKQAAPEKAASKKAAGKKTVSKTVASKKAATEKAATRKATPKKASPRKKTVSKVAAKQAVPVVKDPPRRTIVRRSPIHGRGVFATVDIPKGERVIEYKARKITWAQADRWYADDDSKPSHTFLFTLDDKYVLDGNKDANSARWINHSCKPNCESDIVDGRIWIESLRDIKAGEELNYDYNITLETPHTPAEKRRWSCRCGSKNCRGTLLGKKR
jgi:SET domain-containing protein